MGQRDRASLDALGLAQFIKTPARFTMRDERVFDRLEPEQHRLAVGEERLLLPQILYIDVVVDASAHRGSTERVNPRVLRGSAKRGSQVCSFSTWDT